MSVNKYWEVGCDGCGSACHYPADKHWKQQAIADGWFECGKIFHFCSKECKEKYLTESSPSNKTKK